MNKLLTWLLYTRLGQRLGRLVSGGWCLIRKNDARFVVSNDDNCLHYEGDSSAAPDRGIGNQRNAWKDWILFQVSTPAFYPRFIVIDTYKGERMACFTASNGGIFAIRAGHEAGIIRIGTQVGNYASGDNELRPKFLARWRETNPWPLKVPGSAVQFI
jgi:hypothetical protein